MIGRAAMTNGSGLTHHIKLPLKLPQRRFCMTTAKPWGVSLIVVCISFFSVSGASSETIDEVYKKALKEEGVLNCYCSLAQINAQKIFPEFEKRFPGIRINHVDATSDKLAVRAITEARGGRVIADTFEFGLENIAQLHDQGLLLEKPLPEAAAYPDSLKGPYWTANNLIFSSAPGIPTT